MKFWFKNAVLVVLIALSVAAFAKPAHFLFHVGKGAAYPVGHAKKSSHGVWRFMKEVF